MAIYEACVLRFRPITMTTMAALLGGLPLALGTGDGAELRQAARYRNRRGPDLLSQMLTLYTTPVVYLYLDRFRLWCEPRPPSLEIVQMMASPPNGICTNTCVCAKSRKPPTKSHGSAITASVSVPQWRN